MTCSQIWLSHLVDDHQSTYLTKLEGKNRKTKKPFHEAIFSHLEIPEPSFSLRFSILNILSWIWRLQMWKQKWNSISCQIFPVFCQFSKFWKFWKVCATFELRKKRKEKGRTSFCRYLNHVELVLHSYMVVLQTLNIVWKLSLVLSIDTMENKHGGKKHSTNSIVVP